MRPTFAFVLLLVASAVFGQSYDIGSPSLRDVWVDPVSGSDSNGGTARGDALRTLTEAWNRIPIRTTLTNGVRVQLVAGTYPRASVPNYFESRYGTAQFPIIINSADGAKTAHIQGDLNIFDTRYLYLLDLDLVPVPAGDVVHCELCDHFLVRGCHLDGGARLAQETLKVNQSTYVYVESSDIHGSFDNAIDYVAVEYGHVINNKVHDSQDWCEYAKGGSAYLRIEGNEFYNCGTGGFTAGQGSGFQFLSPPWIHYEAYDIKVINNVIHDTEGAGLGVNGGYDILLAHNTLYRVGSRSHMLEVVFGLRSCDGNPGDMGRERCQQYLDQGGWGTTIVSDGTNEVNIPNLNIYVYNNLFYNPPGFVSPQHFNVPSPRLNEMSSNAPSPAFADMNLQIRGNVIFNGSVMTPLGVDEATGCAPGNETCNETQLRVDNTINLFEPTLRNAAALDFHPTVGSNLFTAMTFAIPDFTWSDAPTRPVVPVGTLTNTVAKDRDGVARAAGGAGAGAGAYETGVAPTPPPPSRKRAVKH